MALSTYFSALAVVANAISAEILTTLGRWVGLAPLPKEVSTVTGLFSHPLPALLQHALLTDVQTALLLAFAGLIVALNA